jgi:hypothetical protein
MFEKLTKLLAKYLSLSDGFNAKEMTDIAWEAQVKQKDAVKRMQDDEYKKCKKHIKEQARKGRHDTMYMTSRCALSEDHVTMLQQRGFIITRNGCGQYLISW